MAASTLRRDIPATDWIFNRVADLDCLGGKQSQRKEREGCRVRDTDWRESIREFGERECVYCEAGEVWV